MKLKAHQVCSQVSALLCAFLLLVLSLGFDGFAVADATEVTAKDETQNRITSLRAFLYYQEKGEFSREDVFSGRVALRNVIIGAGHDKGPSDAMLVLVGVKHSVFGYKSRPSTLIKLIVKTGKKTVTAQEVPLRSFWSERPTIEIPFIVYRTGCEPLEIIAMLVEQKKVLSSLSHTAEFNCGE